MLAIALFIMVILGLMMTVRVTEHPIRIGFSLTESSANTFTTNPIPVPGVASISLTRGRTKALGLEVMKIRSTIDLPSNEDDQENTRRGQIVKGQTPTALVGINNQRTILDRIVTNINNFTTSGGASDLQENAIFDDLTDGDGNGELVLDNEIHASTQGTGNADAGTWAGYLLCHLVEFDAEEAVFEILENAI